MQYSSAQDLKIAMANKVCYEYENTLRLNEKGTQDAIQYAAKYIVSIVGDTIFANHIQFVPCSSWQMEFNFNYKNASDSLLKRDTSYKLSFRVFEGTKGIGGIDISIDRFGNILKHDVDTQNTPAELIYGFKKYFTRGFKIDYAKASQIALKAGFKYAGFLDCGIQSEFKKDSNKNEFATIKYYWRVGGDFKDGRADAYIDVQTGNMERFWYMPGGVKE